MDRSIKINGSKTKEVMTNSGEISRNRSDSGNRFSFRGLNQSSYSVSATKQVYNSALPNNQAISFRTPGVLGESSRFRTANKSIMQFGPNENEVPATHPSAGKGKTKKKEKKSKPENGTSPKKSKKVSKKKDIEDMTVNLPSEKNIQTKKKTGKKVIKSK